MAHICGTMSSRMGSTKAFVAAPKQRMAQIQARPLTVAMAKKAKAADLRTEFATTEAIDAEVQQLKKDLFSMRIKFAKREDYSPANMKATRQRVAQLLTIRREAELAKGISKRESRALQRKTLVEAGLGKFAN